ncbi:MAG: ABC transporter permease [Planctomycetaceae bacterium]
MRLTVKLLWAQYCRHWLRTLLALGALVTSVAMVVVFVGGQDITMAQAQMAAGRSAHALGSFDMVLYGAARAQMQADRMRMGPQAPRHPIKSELLTWLRDHRSVESMREYCQASVDTMALGASASAMPMNPMARMGMTWPLLASGDPEPPFPLERGKWVSDADANEVVIDYTMASRLAVVATTQPAAPPTPARGSPFGRTPEPPAGTLGTAFQITTTAGRQKVRIGGVIKLPVQNRTLAAMYVSNDAFQRLTGAPPATNRALLKLKNGVSQERFLDELVTAAHRLQQPIDVQTNSDFQSEAARMGGMAQRSGAGFFPLLRNAGMNLAILAAMFVIFSTLNIGLQERSRQLAMMRAVGMTRGGVVGLIAAEALVVATAGYLLGLLTGIFVMKWSVSQIPSLAGQDVPLHVGLWAALGALTAYGATAAAPIVPAIFASRRKPLESMSISPLLQSAGVPAWLVPVGLALVAVNPVVTLTEIVPETWRAPIALPISCLAAITGFALLLPFTIALCERVLSRAAALPLGLNHRLLARQLSAGLWRTVGCATALMVGLGLYVTVQIWGQSMLRPFVLSARSPDAVITVQPDGIAEESLAAVEKLPGVASGKVVAMIMQHPDVTDLPEHVMKADEVIKGVFARTVIYLGCDVHKLLDERDGMMQANFVRGRAKEAFARLEQGDACLLTDSFYNRAPEKYDVGQTIEMDSMGGATARLKYTIAGVIEIPGWQWLTKFSQMRSMGRVGGLVIVPTATAAAAYPGAAYKNFWLKMEDGRSPLDLELPIVRIADPNARVVLPSSRPANRGGGTNGGMMGGGPGGGGSGMGGMAGRGGGGRGRRGGMSGPPRLMIDSAASVTVTDMHAVTSALMNRAGGILDSLTTYPLMALGLSALAVVGTMMTSVRVRNWEIGILRGIGMTRWQLLRLILAEGVLIALVATVASLLFGTLISWTGIASSKEMWGVHATFVIPWDMLLYGIGATIALCLIAGVWPAINAACRQPLRLLQEGRSMN